MACNSNTGCPSFDGCFSNYNACGVHSASGLPAGCPTNATIWTNDPLVTGVLATHILSGHIIELQDAINDEYWRRNYVYQNHMWGFEYGYSEDVENNALSACDTPPGSAYWPNSGFEYIAFEEEIADYHVEQLYEYIMQLKTMSWPSDVDTDLYEKHVKKAQFDDLRNNLNDCENDCLCDCDYCTCNCNYCPCDCNYCTCDCNYCPCNCNYCPCNCNQCSCNGHSYSCPCNCNTDGGQHGCTGRGCKPLGSW